MQLLSSAGNHLISLFQSGENILEIPTQLNDYAVILVSNGNGEFHSDFGKFPFQGPVILFATPLQLIQITAEKDIQYQLLQFHGDFYCIEYHRKEVACNGILFNNIYNEPCLDLTESDHESFLQIMQQIGQELKSDNSSDIVLKSLLQLFLAKSSQLKKTDDEKPNIELSTPHQIIGFKELLEQNFLTIRKVSDYAKMLNISTKTLTNGCHKNFKKTPLQLINDRLILEAKKQLHLTRKSIKEIAYELNFNDEFYFSRFFKKNTQVSPQVFRKKAGISIVADLSM